jgi:DNA/RNA-binding domain of Phe-tRNA-synthetase-like protein
MKNIIISKEFSDRVADYRLLTIEADVVNTPTSDQLKHEMTVLGQSMAEVMELADINRRPAIAATRAAYKACGKDPNRYRPSQEQLHRRIIRGLGLYNVNALVDLGNVLSLKTGCSVGVFDMAKLQGDTVTLGVGRHDEPYEGIGRGPLNIEGIPVLRDAVGGFGTPTSDNERTKVELSTTRILITVHLFATEMTPDQIIAEADRLLSTYASASNVTTAIHGC